MEGYGSASYGDGMADVYDEWYAPPDTDAAVDVLAGLVGDVAGAPLLELGAGTGRLALALAARGVRVHALDSSGTMLDRLRAKPLGDRVVTHLADMADPLPDGPFGVVVVATNTLFNVTDAARQRDVFAHAAASLAPGGRLVVEASVVEPSDDGSHIEVRQIAADRVVLSVSRSSRQHQLAEGQFVELTAEHGVRLRPWMIRWISPAELDAMATSAGFTIESRWSDWRATPFGPDSDKHVTIYRVAR